MGNTLKKITPGGGTDEKKTNDLNSIINESYEKHFGAPDSPKSVNEADFYRAVCEIVEEMNKRRNNTQFCVPSEEILSKAFNENHIKKDRKLTQEEFGKILQQVIKETGFSGVGAKDTLIYIFGVPLTALFIKQAVMPHAIKNDYFIPGITSATVFVLAKLNKI
ncbi:uncharacterized protein LOC126800952 [Argentina anserina]|uniref:uncharacterized protein LOC126800952 n=1 Tax=Argentina anserina TaxID=57926 RepID=UPI0021763F39|nr:uncharacterized protein LOC126800952 [Potentilla anserina]